MTEQLKKELIRYLEGFTTEERLEIFDTIIAQRTYHLTVVLEDIHKPHNANAVLRNCEGFGVQDVHIIENRTDFDTSYPITMGAHKWLNLYRYKNYDDNITTCFSSLRDQGYQVIATSPHVEDSDLNSLDLSKKTALVFGTERQGISQKVTDTVDGSVRIPMYGFSESFNLSVSTAICLYDLTTRLRKSNIDWQLTSDEVTDLRLDWLKRSIKAGDELSERFLKAKAKG